VSVVANVAINLDARGVTERLKAIRQTSIGAADGFTKLSARAQAVKSIVEAQQGSFAKASTVQGVFAAKVKNTEFAIKAQIAALRDVQSKVQLNGALYQKAAAQIAQYEATLAKTTATQDRSQKSLGRLRNALAAIGAGFAVRMAGRFVFTKTAEVESQTRSLAILAGSAEKAGQIIKELQDLGAVTPFTSTELIDSAKRLQAFGVEADKVVETTRRLADASGATGAELSGLVTAYGQVQAKGRLQGEELLQFQERGIALQEELRKMYGMTGEEFQKALSKGQVSAKAVEVALQNLTNTGGKYANGAIAQSDTLNGRLSTLQDNVDGVAREVGKVLTPALIEILQQLNTSLSQTPAFVEDIALAFQYAAEQIAPFLNGLSQMQWFFTNLTPPGWAMQMIGGASERGKSTIRGAASRQRQSRENSFIGPAAPQIQGPAIPERLGQKPNNLPPPLMIPSATGTGRKKGKTDAERAAEQMQQQLKAADDINFALKNRLAITQETEAVAKRMIEFDVRQNEIAKEYDELKKAAKGADELALINANLVIEQRIAQIEAERDINELLIQRAALMADTVRQAGMPTVYNELEEQDAALQAVLDKYPAIGAAADAAATLATSGISEMIAGTKSAEQVFVEFLSSIADALINTAKQMIAQYIAIGIARMFAGMDGGGGGGFAPSGPLAAVGNINPMPTSFTPFAEGGFVTGPTSAIIGEGGESEYVIPSSKMNAAMSRYSRGARGEGVIPASGGSEGSDTPSATGGPMAIDVRYSVERINDVEYVTASQFQAGMLQAAQQGAAQGEQRTLRRLQQSPSTRKRVGV
jgi:tape measure domain-containing protein